MRVIRAEVLGMCFGVRDALAEIAAIERPAEVTIHGELVHNEAVLADLRMRGFRMQSEASRGTATATPAVLITAHGVSDRERNRLQSAGKELIDTTCPLVRRVHHAAQELQANGFHVLVIGRRGHVEVRGIIEDLISCDVIETAEEVRAIRHRRIGIVCQTTAPARLVEEVRTAVAFKNPAAEIRFMDTVCLPTKEHQRALERLLSQVDVMVIVGGRNSNNTRELLLRCLEAGKPAHHVQSAADLDPAWFKGIGVVGLTAGTSTLDAAIDEVEHALLRIPFGETT